MVPMPLISRYSRLSKGPPKAAANVVHCIDSFDGAAYVGGDAQIAFDGFDAVKVVELVGAALVAGIDKRADSVPFVEQSSGQVGSDAAGAAE